MSGLKLHYTHAGNEARALPEAPSTKVHGLRRSRERKVGRMSIYFSRFREMYSFESFTSSNSRFVKTAHNCKPAAERASLPPASRSITQRTCSTTAPDFLNSAHEFRI